MKNGSELVDAKHVSQKKIDLIYSQKKVEKFWNSYIVL